MPNAVNNQGRADSLKRDIDSLRAQDFSLLRAKHLLRSRELWTRWAVALLSGIAALVPMIIITKAFPNRVDSILNASIITVCVSVLVFGTFITWASSSTHQELATTVSTYAAVLVVFVGVFLEPPS